MIVRCEAKFIAAAAVTSRVNTIETAGYVKDCHLFVATKNPQEKTNFLMDIEIDANVCGKSNLYAVRETKN